MPKKKKIDERALLKIVEGGALQAEIMKKFNFKNSTQLKVAYANALMNAGKVPELKGGRGTAIAADSKISINKRGSLIIPKGLIETFGLKVGDNFTAKKTKLGIQLRKDE